MDSRSAAPLGAGGRGGLGDDDLGVVLQLIEAAGGQHIPRVDARHLRRSAVGYASLNRAHMRGVVLDYIDERGLTVVLNGGGGNEGCVVQSVDQQLCVYELIRKKSEVLIVERRAG